MSATLTICFEVCFKYQDALWPNSLRELRAVILIYTDSTAIFVQLLYRFLKAEWTVDILPGISRFYTVASDVAITCFLATALKQHRTASFNENEWTDTRSSWCSHWSLLLPYSVDNCNEMKDCRCHRKYSAQVYCKKQLLTKWISVKSAARLAWHKSSHFFLLT